MMNPEMIQFVFAFGAQVYLIIGIAAALLAICILPRAPSYKDESTEEQRKLIWYAASLVFTWPLLLKVVFDLSRREEK